LLVEIHVSRTNGGGDMHLALRFGEIGKRFNGFKDFSLKAKARIWP